MKSMSALRIKNKLIFRNSITGKALGASHSGLCCFGIFMTIEHLFFELIRVAIGKQNTLSRPPSKGEWAELYAMSKKQSLVGICFAGLQRLYNEDNQEPSTQNPQPNSTQNQEPITQNLDEVQYLTWMGMAAKIQQRNEVVNRQCVELQARLAADGLRSSILKGQAVASIYPEHLRGLRQSGDIDIYVDCGREKAIEYARGLQGDVDWDYKHLHLKVFPDTEAEMHYVPEVFLNLWKNRRLQEWFAKPEVSSSMFQVAGGLVCPSVEFNLFYILLHTYRHFLYEGVGMRQLVDWYFVLREAQTKGIESKEGIERVKSVIKSLGMMRFTKGVMWIMKEVFGDGSVPELVEGCEPDEKEGRYILEQVMIGGNFGHHDKRLSKDSGKWEHTKNVLRHNWHLMMHYPGDALWGSIWIMYHWIWKRITILINGI